MTKKQREHRQQEALARKIEMTEHQLRRLQSDKKNLEKTLRIRKLIRAGMVFEEAGILDSYNPDEVLIILKKYKGEGM